MGKKSGSGSGIRLRDEQPGSYFRELRNNFWVKIIKFFDADPRSGMDKIRLRDKHPGSAILDSTGLKVLMKDRPDYIMARGWSK
jgi:hypothetical protein